MGVWETGSEAETRAVGEAVAASLDAGSSLLLQGAMGSGKTVLVQGIAAGLGIDPAEIQSPTFTLAHEHRGTSANLVHLDLYRLREEDFDGLGFSELMESQSIKVVEWPERLPATYRGGRGLVIESLSEKRRRITEVECLDAVLDGAEEHSATRGDR